MQDVSRYVAYLLALSILTMLPQAQAISVVEDGLVA